MAKTRCRAVCITMNSELVCVRRNHEHAAHWDRFANRDLYTTENDIDANCIWPIEVSPNNDANWTTKIDSIERHDI